MKVSDFKDKHKGEIAFILGAGPSLHNLDINLIKGYTTIAVNSAISKFPFANFFISDDQDIRNWSYYDILKKIYCVKFLYKDKFKNICRDLSNVVLFDHTWWWSPEDKLYNFDGLKLTKDEPIVGSRSSMGSAVHLAFCMGAKVIVLLGNDCQLKDGKRYFFQFDGEEKQYRTDGRNFEKDQNRGFDKEAFVNYWNNFAEVNKNSDVNIIDASDSCLNCFPKMSVREVLDKYGEEK